MDQELSNPPPFKYKCIRTALLQMAKTIMDQANREDMPQPHQQVTIIASSLMDYTRMNPPSFYGSKVDEDPKNS